MDILDLNDMDQITETIWLGNMNSALNINNLNKHKIMKVLSLIDSHIKNINQETESSIVRKIIKISDFPTKNIINKIN